MSGHPVDKAVSMIIAFLDQIGIEAVAGEVPDDTFLPGIEVRSGRLIFDLQRLKYPGDLLHEAGHLAIAPSELRPSLNGEVEIPGLGADLLEVAAMLWSYAACVHVELDPRIVFHDDGYHGRSAGLLTNFELGVFPGVHVLQSFGMAGSGDDPFPAMQKWLRD